MPFAYHIGMKTHMEESMKCTFLIVTAKNQFEENKECFFSRPLFLYFRLSKQYS